LDLYSIIEWLAAIAGLINVYLLTRQTVLAWPAGLVSVFLYAFVFYHNRLYSDVILHCIYVVINAYGWYHWTHSGTPETGIPVTTFSNRIRVLLSISVLILVVAWGYFMRQNTQADFAYADAFILIASLLAQYLMALKKLENWILWIVVDVVAIVVYSQKALLVTAVLYGVYLLLCILGYRNWSVSLKKVQVQIQT
jgi:nicotinamide mononucleotide transporter